MQHSAKIIQREFDSLAAEYESNRLAGWYKAHSHMVIARCPPSDSGDILDIGCGTGYLLRELKHRFPKANAVGIDVSSAMISQAKRRAQELDLNDIHFLHDDWENLGEQSRRILARYHFKLILCANAFHYFSDPRKSAIDIYNMLEDDGTVLVLEREKSRSVLTWFWGILHRYLIKDHVEFYTASELVVLLEQAGFSGIRIARTIKRYFWKGKLFTSIALIEGHKNV